jgi:diguanylate cyclase (GGDEF)-like protein
MSEEGSRAVDAGAERYGPKSAHVTTHDGATRLRRAEDWVQTRFSSRIVILATCGLLLTQAGVISRFNGRTLGGLLSNLVQLLLGLLCVLSSLQAFRRSGTAGRYYWRWLAATFTIWVVAQGLGTYIDVSSNHWLDRLDDVLFFYTLLPFGMLLFLNADHEANGFDRLHLLDFLQVCVFWSTVYLYFAGASLYEATIGWKWFGWTPSVLLNGVLATTFLLRAILATSPVVRAFFGRMVIFLFGAGLADSYASFAPNHVDGGGHWFDLVWCVLLAIPLVIAATWEQTEPSTTEAPARAHDVVVRQFFPLVFPFFSLLLLAQVARSRPVLASCMIILSFAGVGARVLIFQHRLFHAQAALEFESAHDALTGLWNRAAILEFLDNEVARQKRTSEPVGVMMLDVDHFKVVNDTWGHLAGDMVLREVAKRLAASVRDYNFIGRYGGEEFLIVSQNCDGPAILSSAERLRQAIAESPIGTAQGSIQVTVSVGVVSTVNGISGSDRLTILHAVDTAMYDAKSAGRNCVRCVELEAAVNLQDQETQKLSAHNSG